MDKLPERLFRQIIQAADPAGEGRANDRNFCSSI